MSESSVDPESDPEVKKPFKEVPIVHEEGFFVHDTGDTYDGFFEAKKKDRSVKMQGPGKYTTTEGDVYVGSWEADRLGANEEVSIAFSDGSRYEGMFKDWSYHGHGRYIYPDGSILHGDFVENCPVGQLMLQDCNGHPWLGRAEQGYGWCQPVNHYYEMLEKTREGKTKRKSKDKELKNEIKSVTQAHMKSDNI